MRIISGTYKGRSITPPQDIKARPTTDVAKEGLFNIINNQYYFDQITVLDLFSGTGSISYEFASRGSEEVLALETDRRLADFIQKTGDKLFPEGYIHVIQMDVFKFLDELSSPYDIIFADPPYDLTGIASLPDIIFTRKLLKEEGWFILEHSSAYDFSEHTNFLRVRNYGKVHFSFFENKSETSD